MNIIKRDGSLVEFKKDKIKIAISKANDELALNEKISNDVIDDIANNIFTMCQSKNQDPTVEEVQDMVIDSIATKGYFRLMRLYASYRYKRELLRKANTTDSTIISLIEGNNNELNTENSNKSTVLNSTQRDYIAGEVSKDISKRIMLPERVVKAHNEGILHFHDLDYFIQPMHNCFRKNTKFVTKDGIRSFDEFQDGEKTYVLDMNGNWRLATIRNYGKQRMQTVVLRSGRSRRTVECTENHRWILKDGSVTTNLKEGDILWPLHEINHIKYPYYPVSYREKVMFAFGMVLGDGSDIDHGVRITLCGDKVKYEDIFKKAGYHKYNSLSASKHGHIVFGKSCNLSKQKFLSAKGWEYLQEEDKVALFFGYYAADGSKNENAIHTVDDRLAEMIRSISALAGYHISKEKEIIHDTNFKENARLIQFNFRRNQPNNLCWIVDKITHGCGKMWKNYEFEAWCVEEPVTHSFTLEGGIVTGNCAVIDIDDMLTNGTVMNGKMIESPHTFRVACTVSTQIMAAIASNQYGGQSVDISHFGKFLRRSKEKFEKRIRETVPDTTDEATIQKLIDVELQEELSAGVQTMQYQINSLMTTNGQSPFVTLFLNLSNEHEKEYIEENAMIVEEIIKQRITGIKNESGVYITPAFPKLIYVLDEFNNLTGGKYDYITELAVKCTAKRMYPDYVSAKKMREYYDGNVFPIMGCIFSSGVLEYKYNGLLHVDSFENLWNMLECEYPACRQNPLNSKYLYMDIPDGKLEVYDTKLGEYTKVYRIIKNWATDWRKIKFSNGKCIMVTYDHPFETENRGVVYAKDLQYEDLILYNPNHVTDSNINSDVDKEFLCHPTEIEIVFKSDWSYDLTTESEHFEVDGIYSHNCRSLLSPWKDENGNYKFEGRFNCGVVSINLPQIGIVSNGDEKVFWQEFDNRLELCFEALMEKHKNCKRILSDNSPIHFQHGAISRLKVHESIDKLLYGGYSTLSLGYIGLYELTKIMTGYSHTDSIGLEFALKVMHHLRETADRWKVETNIGFSLYGTPAESLCKRFCDIDTRKFGIIKDVTDKGWYTNSYHVDVREHIDAFSKLKFESQFQPISSGGCISYVEIPNMSKNIAALREMVKFIYDTILYGEFNTKSDYCQVCGFDGEITLNENHEWQCPQCGNKDKALMNVTRRTCGYLGENFWNDKKTLEIENRVLHTS